MLFFSGNGMAGRNQEGFSKGVRVRSMATMTHWEPRPLNVGDVGVVLGPGQTRGSVKVSFDGEPTMIGELKMENLCQEEEFHYRPGARVRSLVTMTHWKPRPVSAGDRGEVIGPGATSKESVAVRFDVGEREPPILGELTIKNICPEEKYELFTFGTRVCSLATLPHWKPRPLRAGDGGVVLGRGDRKDTVQVSFDGEPAMVGELKVDNIIQEEKYESKVEKGFPRDEEDESAASTFLPIADGEEDEVQQLRRDIAQLREENEELKRTAPCGTCMFQ